MKRKLKIRKAEGPKTNSPKKTAILNLKSVSGLFGVNKKEIDGLEFQKRARNKW